MKTYLHALTGLDQSASTLKPSPRATTPWVMLNDDVQHGSCGHGDDDHQDGFVLVTGRKPIPSKPKCYYSQKYSPPSLDNNAFASLSDEETVHFTADEGDESLDDKPSYLDKPINKKKWTSKPTNRYRPKMTKKTKNMVANEVSTTKPPKYVFVRKVDNHGRKNNYKPQTNTKPKGVSPHKYSPYVFSLPQHDKGTTICLY